MSNLLNLDRILLIFFGKNIFTDLDSDINRISIDVRSFEESSLMSLLSYTVPVINKKEHTFLHKHLYLAAVIVFYGLFKNRKYIKEELLRISNNRKNKILIGCSKGRLRSPAVWLYASYLGIDAKILKNGIKPHFKKYK
ncbi:MAG: hypothetical protein RRZ84_09105 [Romboutsia sp.]